MARIGIFVTVILLSVPTPSTTLAEDWPQFRGPRGTGVSGETGLPLTWTPEQNVKWRTGLPGAGNSSPIVSNRRVFVAVATEQGSRRHLYCFDRIDGRRIWTRTVAFSGDEPTHATNPYCGATPAADGRRVVAWHSSAGLHCYDFEGNELWSRDLGKFVHIWGYGSSPIISDDSIILNCGPGPRTFLVALDKHTGRTLWRSDEPGGATGLPDETGKDAPWLGSWSTPLVLPIDGHDQILLSFPHHVQGYSRRTGRILWRCEGLGDLVYTSVVPGEGLAVAASGYYGPAIAFRLGGTGDVTDTNRLWVAPRPNPQRIGSGIIIGRHLYMANEPGTAVCINVQTGEERWLQRLPGGAKVWGSLVLGDGRFYVTNQNGDTIVWRPDPEKLDVLALNSLGERSNSTPAVSDGEIFLRTFDALYCITADQ